MKLASPPPTPAEMKTFAARFEPHEWDYLCRDQVFLDKFTEDLVYCRPLAEKILSRRHRKKSTSSVQWDSPTTPPTNLNQS